MLRREKLEKAIAALAAGQTIREAAKAADVNPRTIQRRLANPAFKASIMEARAAGVSTATAKLLAGMNEAADVLMGLLRNGDARIQQRAAVKLIELVMKLNAAIEQEARIEQLERYVGFHNVSE